MQAKEYNLIIFILIITLLMLLLVAFITTILYLYRKKQIAFYKSLETIKAGYEKSLLSAQLEMQEYTFQHISREIHDNICLSLTLAKLYLNTINWNQPDTMPSQIDSTVELLTQSISKLSNISKGLNSDVIDTQGLIKAVEIEVARIKKAGIFTINYLISGDPVYMDSKKELIIFRIIQEAFNNIIKHANASIAVLKLNYTKERLFLTIEDNGKGFSEENKAQLHLCGKAGLSNMKSRTEMIGGNISISSKLNIGSTLYFDIPF